jgi:chemotaxis protein methyltransferase CheR
LFEKVLELIRQTVGIRVPEDHYTIVFRSLDKRQSILRLSMEEYFAVLSSNSAELEIFLNGVTNNETYFFREEKQFKVLRDVVYPEMVSGDSLRFWSATCATGEEAVSLALLAHECFGKGQWENVKIYATDINTDTLDVLREGCYRSRSFKKDGESFRYLLGNDGTTDSYAVSDVIKDRMVISRLNLYKDAYEVFPDELDLVFFRNTLIYYDETRKSQLISRVISRLKPGGYFFVSATEVPFVPLTGLKLLERDNIYYFRKQAE